ncbi:hypothetical protein GOV03_04690 [Candidatus Woesearchaeota archaeon]|nr:hypothetical protein [Candidatus Woesearchaeota archaeon]
MAFWKNAVASLGMLLTLSSAIPSKGGELKPREQKSQVEVTLEKKLQEDLDKPQKYTSTGPLGWTTLSSDILGSASAFYKLPQGFDFNLNGDFGGKGFTWKLGEDDFYYRDAPILEYFKSLDNLDNTYLDDIGLGGTSLGSFINLFNSEKDWVGNTFLNNVTELKDDLMDIYSNQYSEEFLYELIVSVVKGDLEGFFDDHNITEQQKRDTEEAVEEFLEDTNYLFDHTFSDDVIRNIIDGDLLSNITLKDRSLRNIVNLAEGLSDLMELQISDDYVTARLNLEGKGKVDTAVSFTQNVKLGDQEWVFDHVVASKNHYGGKIFFNLDLKLTEGVKISEFFDIDPLLVLLYRLSDFDIHLRDINLNAIFDLQTETLESLSESFEIAKVLERGKYGLGIVYEKRNIRQETGHIFLNFEFKTESKEWLWKYNEMWKSMREGRTRNLIYVFSEEQQDLFWYSATAGLELFDDDYKWYNRVVKNGRVKSRGDSKELFDVMPRLNLAAGVKGLAINPFIALKTFPDSVLRAGMVLDVPYVVAKVSLEQALGDEYYERLLSHSLEPAMVLAVDASVVLFDDSRKVLDYHTAVEQIEASPKPGKQTKHDRVLRKLCSDLDGLLFNVRLMGPELLLRTTYGADNSFFIGGGYFSDLAENIHGVDLIIGYEDFLFKGRYGYTNQNNHYGHLANISAGGNINDLFLIQFDLRALLLPETESTYEGVIYGSNDLQASLKFIGFF